MTDTVTHPEKPLKSMFLQSVQYGGYMIYEHARDGYCPGHLAAFSTLDEALKWLKKAMEK